MATIVWVGLSSDPFLVGEFESAPGETYRVGADVSLCPADPEKS
jgi:hypothetical protein